MKNAGNIKRQLVADYKKVMRLIETGSDTDIIEAAKTRWENVTEFLQDAGSINEDDIEDIIIEAGYPNDNM